MPMQLNLQRSSAESSVDGASDVPGASPMQAQVARLRALRKGGATSVESDVFVPLSHLVVEPQEQLNALVVVGSPPNLDLIEELVGMLDIKAAAPRAIARIYPVKHGSAERLAVLISAVVPTAIPLQTHSSKRICLRQFLRLEQMP